MACSICNCREGRGCPGSVDASRAALGLPPLREGGNYHAQYSDPIGTPEHWMSRTAGVVGLVLLAVACVGAVWIIAAAMGAPVGLIL
jgi:hypothetical protein